MPIARDKMMSEEEIIAAIKKAERIPREAVYLLGCTREDTEEKHWAIGVINREWTLQKVRHTIGDVVDGEVVEIELSDKTIVALLTKIKLSGADRVTHNGEESWESWAVKL